MHEVYQYINHFLEKNNLETTTSAYNVPLKIQNKDNINQNVIDVYVGVKA